MSGSVRLDSIQKIQINKKRASDKAMNLSQLERDERNRFRFAESGDFLSGPDPFTELPFL